MLLAQIAYVRARCLEDPQPEQAEHRYQREIGWVRRFSRGSEHRLELQVSEPQCRRLRRHDGPADMLGRRMVEYAVDHGGAIEPRGDREPSRHRRGLEPATSCIQRMYSSRWTRLAASGSKPRSAHHDNKHRKSEWA